MFTMLPRAITRSLRAPALQTSPVGFRLASAQWPRTLASNARRGPPKKPVDYSKPANVPSPPRPSSIGPQRTTSAGAAGSAHQARSASESSHVGESSQHSKQHGRADLKASHTEPESPSSSSEKTSEDISSPEPQEPARPLPDLTQGIPSTLEYETMGSTSSARPEGTHLNLTEDPAQSPGGRGRGELPASAYVSSSEKKRLRIANYMYAGFAISSILGYIYLGRNWESDEEESKHPDAPSGWALGLMWGRAKARMGDQLNYYNEPAFKKLLPDPDAAFERPYTLVLSLEDLLVHSEWSREHGWRMAKRPGVDYFLRYLSQYYELVIFTSVPWAVAEPIIKKLDPYHIVMWPLFREATMYKNGEYVKDLSYLNRDLSKVILIDTVPGHAREQPENAIILDKWVGDPQDKVLVSLIPFLEYIPTMGYSDVRQALKSFEGTYIPKEFAAREAIARQKFEAQMALERQSRPRSGLGGVSRALGVKPVSSGAMEGEQSAAEAFAQGKMLQDQARERGQKVYEQLEKMIREEGDNWLKEEAAHEEAAKQEGMKAMKSGLTGFFGVPATGAGPEAGSSGAGPKAA